ncbi:MAG: ATP-binding protein [Dehalococcoidia bacterium]
MRNNPRTRADGRWSPRLYILGVIGLLLIPLALTAMSVWQGADASEARVRSERLARAQLSAQSLSSFVDARLATVQALARSPDIRDLGNRPDLRGFLDQALADTPDWESLAVFESAGTNIIGTGPDLSDSHIADRSFLQDVISTNRPVIGPPAIGEGGQFPTVPLAAPIEFVNGSKGVLIAWLSTGKLNAALAAADHEDGIESTVIDALGNVIAHSDPEALPARDLVDRRWDVEAIHAGGSGVTVTGDDSPATLIAYAPVPAAPWSVVISQPAGAAFSTIRNDLRTQLILIGITAVVISVLAYRLVNRLSRAYDRQLNAIGQVDAFISAASHDLKTPLTAIKSLAQLLQRRVIRLGRNDAPWLLDSLAEIDAAANRMTRQINDLLDVARFQRGAVLELQRRPTDIVALTRRVAAEQQKTTDRHAIRVNATLESITGLWDGERLERVVANLLGNAIKYSPAGGDITVQLCREVRGAPHVGANGFQAAAEWAVLSVEDHGMGIPQKDLPYVFDHYHRGENVAEIISGTGIGLSGARQIVEQHGGALSVVSSEGDGSTFTVRLPLAIVGGPTS